MVFFLSIITNFSIYTLLDRISALLLCSAKMFTFRPLIMIFQNKSVEPVVKMKSFYSFLLVIVLLFRRSNYYFSFESINVIAKYLLRFPTTKLGLAIDKMILHSNLLDKKTAFSKT